MATSSTHTGTAASGSAPFARRWESVISYEDRSNFHTSRWRLTGIKTKEDGQNTDSGVLWLKMTKSGDTATATLYKDDGLASGNAVATGTADVSSTDGTGTNAAEVTLSQSNSSGLSGSFWIHQYTNDANVPVQVALCVDEDLDSLWDAIDDLNGYDSTYGMAEFIRFAGEDVLGAVAKMFKDELGGHGSAEAWFITDASRNYPDLRRIANPGQLRIGCAHRALAIALGREHQRASETAYSELRDYHNAEYQRALTSLVLAVKSGSGDNAAARGATSSHRPARA